MRRALAAVAALRRCGPQRRYAHAKCQANNARLSPVPYLQRAAMLNPDKTAVKYGDDISLTYSELMTETRQLASAVSRAGVLPGQVVSVLVPNVPVAITCHFAIPGMGATLHMINTRLDARAVAFQLEHAESKLLIVDCELAGIAKDALEMIEDESKRPHLIQAEDPMHAEWSATDGEELRDFMRTGDPNFELPGAEHEDDAIALSYTSGTTGNPKGVLTHHRGAALNSMSVSITWPLVGGDVKYLWTLPMFHCNGWCLPWAITAVVMNLLLGATEEEKAPVTERMPPRVIQMMTGGAAPPPSVMRELEQELGIRPLSAYGLTEVYGPCTSNLWDDSWDDLEEDERGARLPWQAPSLVHEMYVAEKGGFDAVPADGVTLGEVLLRGNAVMKGYLNNEEATKEAFDQGQWFRTGDMAVQHPGGRVEIKDREKDIIISGGENISSIEVETALHQHEGVLHVAVVALPDPFWGETPVAVIEAKPGAKVSGEDIISHARSILAKFKCPKCPIKDVIFRELPKTATGKIQKHVLRAELLAERTAKTKSNVPQ
ncbi:acyl-CoA synthase [Ectocarpus siliculosus]|uniref:Acyl-CoA synthase n=1 Tax=Ectocarpus siliculosus TaxID=2880 RepID=D7FGQ3_ECTSI|nr:acyl-CoA synthase [Ectocarpus siliculosus]|eukprot:CBJ28329.1 acyl-CoA synthase [Ectocarpus siliculosus]